MKIKHYIALAALTMPLATSAQSTVIDFETTETQGASLGVFDTWEDSPFRKGKLEGNVKVINNPYKVVDDITNDGNISEKVLAFQRSRFGSNTFGVRVGLPTPIKLTPKVQYVHVKMYTPKTGHIMLFALGSRDDRPEQSKDVVQVEANCISSVKAEKWCDAVFAISSAPGVSIHSLLIAPDVQSTHDLDEDYAVYIDDIEINSSSMPNIQYGVYPLNFDKSEQSGRTGSRYTQGITLKTADGNQTIAVAQKTNKLMYQDLLASSIKAKAGESATASIDYIGGWMHAYVYLDKNNDGKFDLTLNEDGTPGAESDIMSYSVYQGKNSAGNAASGNNKNLPAFNIPSNLTPGFYRLRYKIDWDNIDAGGNAGDAQGNNSIKSNGGVIVDTRLNVHGEKVNISRGLSSEGTNGEMTKLDGSKFEKHEIEFGKPYTVKFKPADNFKLGKFTIRHGYNVEGKDSLINETPQYTDVVIPAYMAKDNTYTIPAEYVDGDIVITPTFVSVDNSETTEKYAVNFPKNLKINRSDSQRKFGYLAFSTASNNTKQKINAVDPDLIYLDGTSKKIYVKSGEAITTDIYYNDGKAPYMHAYLYVDLDGDGKFDLSVNADGTPAFNGEMLSYTYANGKNSKGQNVGYNDQSADQWGATNSMPQFSLPAGLPTGAYRGRLKIDWDCTDPAGRYGSKYDSNFIDNNGGHIVDFVFNVVDEYPKVKLDVQTTDGSIVGAGNTGLPEYIMEGQDIDVKAVGLGKCVIHARSIDGKELYDEPVYLHAARSGHSLVTWNADGINSNSALFIEPVDENDMAEEMPETIKKNVLPNSMQIWCYGAGFSVKEGTLYEYKGASLTDTEISLAFNKIEAAKAVAFKEALQPEFKEWALQVKKNASVLAEELIKRGFTIVSGGTDNHSMLVDLRDKYPELTGKVAENALVAADITVNKNMVPFDTRSAFQTSGIRLGTPAITTRGAKEDLMVLIAELIEEVLNDPENEEVIASVRKRVNETMKNYPIFAY